MKRTIAIRSLKKHARAIKGMGVTAFYLFGSTARDEARVSSDLDVFIDYDPTKKFSLPELGGIEPFLEEQLDLTTRNSLHPMLRRDIEQNLNKVEILDALQASI